MPAAELSRETVRLLLPPRARDAHKGTFGHVFVIAGSRGFTGAAKLAGLAAVRAGAGLVTVGVPRALGDVVAAGLMEVMTLPLRSTRAETISREAVPAAVAFAQDKSAAALGPGLSQHRSTQEFVRKFVGGCPIPMVVDADGLNALAGHTETLHETKAPPILTPHPGEMARLCRCSAGDVQRDRESIAAQFAQEHRCVVVLKGHRTVIADAGGGLFVNPTGNSGMATGGTGDVLTGLLGGLLAQGLGAADAARLGVYLHGLAGDLAASDQTERGMTAGDLLERIPAAWRIVEGAFEA